MTYSPQQSYLTTEVMTAPPQKLQLMLLDTAIRSAERARLLWQETDEATAAGALDRAQLIVGEILAGLKREADPELVGKVSSVYLFLFRTLGDASVHRDQQKLEDALAVLRVERETWRQLCEKLAGASSSPDADVPSNPPVPTPHMPESEDVATHTGFSLEA